MNDKQINAVLTYLVEASRNKQLSWDIDFEGDFRLTFPKSSLVLDRQNADAITLRFLNDEGLSILTIHPGNIARFGLKPEALNLIYEQAENQIYRHDETLEDILKNLPRPQPPE